MVIGALGTAETIAKYGRLAAKVAKEVVNNADLGHYGTGRGCHHKKAVWLDVGLGAQTMASHTILTTLM